MPIDDETKFCTLERARIVSELRFWIADIPVDVIGRNNIVSMFERAVTEDSPFILANLNLHGLYCSLRSQIMGDLLRDTNTIVHIDGAPILWAAYLAGINVPAGARNAHIDLIPELLKVCARQNWPVVILNSDEAGAAQNYETLTAMFPGLDITAIPAFFDLDDVGETSFHSYVVHSIKKIRPALLLVGMGMPRQEIWISSVFRQLDVPMIMPIGGFADYFTGRTRMPPRVLGPLGLEWVYRLVHSPRRLGARYLIEPFLLIALLAQRVFSDARWGRETRLNIRDVKIRDN